MNATPRGRAARWAQVLLWVVPALWSSNYVIARAAEGVIAPHLLATGRWLLAGLILWPFVGRGLLGRRAVWRSEWKQLLVLGTLGMWICGAWVYLGGQTTTSTNIALIYAATPVAIAVLSARLLHERLSLAQKLGGTLALLGVLFVVAKGQPQNLLAVRFTVGDGWIVACAVSWTAYSVLLKYWPSRLSPGERLLAIIAGGLVLLLPFTALEAWLAPGPPLGPGWEPVLAVLGLASLCSALAYLIAFRILANAGATALSLVTFLIPISAAGLGWLVLGERLETRHLVGLGLILAGLAVIDGRLFRRR